MKVVANVPVSLTPGTYWVAIAADHVGSLAPFGNPVTVWGELASGNGLKFQGGWSAWIDLADGVGTSAPLDLPFLIYGIVDGTLCDHPVTNLNADVIGNNVALTWTAPAGSPTGYEILFDGELLTTVTGTSYTHNNVPTGNHKYGVSALFAGGCYPQTVYTPNLLVGNFCPLYFIMGDGYGDGWDIGTAYITVEVDGVVYGTVTLEDGSYGTQEVLIPAGILKLYWNVGYSGGNYDDEVYFICYDDDGNTLYETGYNGMYGKYGEFYDDEFFCGEKTYYNVYCGSDLVVGNVTKKSYTTSAYDLFETQTWSVRTVCEDGLSAPISVTKEPCEIDCPAPASLDVVYSPDCGTATLTWEMPTGGKGKMIPIDPNRKGVTDIPVDEKIKERITKMIEAAQARRESGDLPPLKDKTRGADSEAFAFNTSYWAYVSFPLNDPSNMNYINYEPDYCFGHTGADIIDDEWYFVNFRDFCYWTLDYKLYRVDMETGIRTVAGMHDVPQPVGMAYNKADGFVYMISYVGSGYSELYKYDMNTGVTTYINYISGDVWDGGPIVFANDGRCIMLDFNYGDIAELDITTGVTTYLTSTGFYLGTYFQDLAVDRETGDIYWTGMEADYYESVYYRYDLNTNTLTNLGYIESQMTALIIPEGKKYNIYMDGEMIAENVSGNTYKTSEYDLFETHLWEVKAVCFDIYESDPISVTMEPCEVECDSPTALNVEYSEDCNTAFITWDPVAGKGKGKSPMMGNTEKRYVTLPEGYDPSSGISIATFMKDQFTGEMPTPVLNSDGGKSCPVALPYFENFSSCANWALPACWSRPTMINFYGMLIPGVDEYDYYSAPKCVWMFADDVPNYLVTPAIPGNIHKVKMTVALMREGYGSGPMTIGVMSDPNNLSTFEVVEVIDVPDDYTYYMYEVTFEGTTLAGSDRYIAFKQNAADTYSYWIDDVEITIDIVPLYNVYCGGEKIAGPIEETYFDHTGFDKTIGHTWSVTQVCFDIYESDPIEFTLEACDPSVCNAPTTVAAEYSADCNSVTITWGAPEGKSGGKGMSAPENPVIIHEASSEEIEMMNSSIAVMNTNTSVVSKTSNSIAFDEQYIEDKKAALQSRGARAITKPPIVSAPPSKGVIFYEGFEGSSGYDLPSTWTIVNYGYTDDWYAYEEEGYAVDGVYVMSHDDYYDDRDVWAFSPGFELTADVAYNISFYLNMPGYGPGDYDAMEVKIGQAKTASGMTNLVYQKLYEPTGYWDFIEKTFTPTTSGTYYLGIHAMTEAWGGNYIDVDAILIQTAPEPVYYNVYCDGNLLGTTTNLYFNDDTFNNATGHTWSVATVCGDGESERINVTLEVCEIECFPVTNLNAYYGDNCTAELTWDAPTGEGLSGTMTLWDNTNAGIGTGGLISTYWSGNDNWVMCADDFEASGAWTIEKVYTKGFSNSPSVVPTKICLVIFADDDNKPGAELYRNNAIPVASGTDPVITLPTPFTLPSAGKYWIGISGTYDVSVPPSTLANFRWNISYGAGKVGSNYQLHDPSNMFGEGTDWMDASGLVPGSYSMHFKLEGNANNSEIYAYNIYRNGALLTKNHPLPYYSDSGFDAFEGHTWAVTLVCGNDETAPTTVSLASCKVPLCYDTETQTIGSGTIGSQYLPIYHYYNYSYSQQIYDAAEVGGTAYTGRVISAISFYSVRVAPITKNPIMVYLGNTTQATFTSTTNWITAADLQHVHTGTITYGGTPGWVTIQFDEPFIYTGGNVVVALLNDDGSYTDDTQIAFNTTAATNKSLYNGRDTAPILITAPPSGTRPANRNNIKFEFCPIPEWVEITTEVEPAGSGNVTGGGTYAGGATVTLTATAEPGYFFTNWNNGSTNSTITFTAMIDATYTAYFAECLPITELNVQYDPVYCKATLTWDNVDPLYRYNVYRDDVQVATSVVSPYIDSGFDATEGHTWSVTLVCGDGESDPVFETLGPCDVGCDNVIIGTGTTGSYDMPLNTYYSFSYVQHIYTAADVGEAGTIKALAFQYFLGTPNIKNNQVYYLANTTKMDFTSSTDWFPVSEMTQVFAGDLVYDNANEWFVVTLDTPFEYTGCGLVLAVLNNHGSYSTGSSSTFRVSSTTPANRTIQYRKDNSPAGPIDPSALPTATGRSVNRTNTLFHICPTEEPYTPQPPVALTATQIECTSFVANWETVDGAANYLLSVYSEDYEEVIVLEEDFTGLGGNNMDNNGSSTAWAGNANFPTLARAYQAGNAVRLGKGTPTPTDGYITSKPLDLSGGDVIINFDIKGWANYETDLFVSIDGGTPQVVTYTNLMLPGPFEHKTLIFPAATANSTVTFSSQVGASTAKRLFLDNIVISVVQPTNNYIVEDVAVGNGSTYSKLVEGLTPGTTYYYSVKTVEMCLTGESSNEIEVTTLPVYSITVTTGENGTVTPAGPVITLDCHVDYASFTFEADACYEIDEVLINGVNNLAAVEDGYYDFTGITGDQTIEVTFKLITYAITTDTDGNGSITPAEDTVDCGDGVTFTITPDACYELDELWINDTDYASEVVDGTYTIEVLTEDLDIYVTFKLIEYDLDATAGQNGSISPTETTVTCGSEQSFTITPDACYEIDELWDNDVNKTSSVVNNTYTITNITENHSISVTFSRIIYTITASTGPNGFITPSGQVAVECGDEIAFYFEANSGFAINMVYVDGIPVSGYSDELSGDYTFEEVDGNHNIYVTFVPTEVPSAFTIIAGTDEGATITPTGEITVNPGANQKFTFVAKKGYQIVEVLIDGDPDPMALLDGFYTFENVQADHTIYIVCEELEPGEYCIFTDYTAGGTISPNGLVCVPIGTDQTFLITPQQGFKILEVKVDGIVNVQATIDGVYTFSDVQEEHTLYASFTYIAIEQFYINASVSTVGGSVSPAGKVMVTTGDEPKFTFTPQAGYQLKDVLVDGISVMGDVVANVYTFAPVVCAHTIVGTFEKQTLTITSSIGTAGGSISPVGEKVVPYGGSQAYTITTQTGFLIDEVLINGVNNPAAVTSGKYTFSNVTSSQTIVVNFKYRTYDIVATQTANGQVSPPGTTPVVHGSEMTYNIYPNTGYMIKTVLINGKNNVAAVANGYHTFTNVTAKQTISATFAPLTSTLADGESTANELLLYPNPTTGKLTINNGEEAMEEIQVFDLLGKKVMEYKVEDEVSYKIDMTILPAGIYFVRIKTETNVEIRKVVKQ
ncbi:MAG: T9SS type A sorting domain-containing protein [Bacteroidales bacterium]|nr:T9SS type A sorting domain-containing protein [Bacteroidales bacterium]